MSEAAPAFVLDAPARLALLLDETGAERVLAALPRGLVSAVNLSEVVAKLAERGVPAAAIRTALAGIDLDVRPFDAEAAYVAGELRGQSRRYGLPFGDRACLGLARTLGAVALTADRAWVGALEDGPEVELLR